MADEPRTLDEVLTQAARLQELVPGAVLVGGALHARHRLSFDDDHVIADLGDRFTTILDHLEALDDWSTARVRQGKIVLGELGGIETGIRQLRRRRPLETEQVEVQGRPLVVPTAVETLRIKAWLAVTRNQTRDHLDIDAQDDHLGIATAATALRGIDRYDADLNDRDDAVSSQVARQLADPRPRDARVTTELAAYKQLDPRWHDWDEVRRVLLDVAEAMLR